MTPLMIHAEATPPPLAWGPAVPQAAAPASATATPTAATALRVLTDAFTLSASLTPVPTVDPGHVGDRAAPTSDDWHRCPAELFR
ncbi:hypothetical protein GCM10009610_68770 [Pseudonocardia xinjiangensis]